MPGETASDVLKLEYISWPDRMVNASDTLTTAVAPVFQELVETYAVYKAKYAESIRGNGVNTYGPAQALLADLYSQFRDIIRERSHSMDYIKPFNPSWDD